MGLGDKWGHGAGTWGGTWGGLRGPAWWNFRETFGDTGLGHGVRQICIRWELKTITSDHPNHCEIAPQFIWGSPGCMRMLAILCDKPLYRACGMNHSLLDLQQGLIVASTVNAQVGRSSNRRVAKQLTMGICLTKNRDHDFLL